MKIKQIISIVLVIFWMITVFKFSNQQGSSSSGISKKVSMKIVEICDIQNKMSQEQKIETSEKIEPFIRKLAHYIIYIIGGILILNCLCVLNVKYKNAVIIAMIIGVAYATSDEIHQLFVGGRSGRVVDVVIDSIGICTGIVMYRLVQKILKDRQIS